MEEQSINTKQIARWLNDHSLQGIAAFLLEVGRPFSLLGAQAAYLAEPLFGGQRKVFRDFAQFLEDPEQIDAFMAQLTNDMSDSS
jgi:hypothetical protein